MKQRILFSLLAWAIVGIAAAQQPSSLRFNELTHDFGVIEQNAKAEFTFRFTNTTAKPLTLLNVRASCGCTTPSWTREAIEPSKEGEIQVAYNTARPGTFQKTVTVTYDSAAQPVVLTIKGNVIAKPAETVFQYPQGNLAFEQSGLNTGTLDSDKEILMTIRVKNSGPKEIVFTGKYEQEGMFEIKPRETMLVPGQTGTIEVKALGGKFSETGAFTKTIGLHTTDEVSPIKTLTISGSLNKVYSAEELARMPNIRFESLEYNAGKVLEGEKVSFSYKFTNTGKEDLLIESVRASCGCTAPEPKDKVVKAGQSSEITATFDSRGRQGVQNKTITVRSNDPDNGTVILKLNVEVERDPFHMGGQGPAAAPGLNNN
jgi:hypothetical protein